MRKFVRFAIVSLVIVLFAPRVLPDDLVRFVLPANEVSKTRVVRASDWLNKHIVEGTMSHAQDLGPMTLVAWHDPTLAPTDGNALAAYAITDSLWASRALTLQYPAQAEAIADTLQKLNCHRNNLHEVLFQPVNAIHHRSDDKDIVHGSLLGTFQVDHKTISVRSFRMRWDADYSIGHPSLFAEHAVYQSLFHFWNGKKDLARQHLASIFDSNSNSRRVIRWDRDRSVLVDHVNAEDYQRFLAKESTTCRQYTFKLALIVYAVRLLNLDVVDEAVLRQMQDNIWSSQLISGGIPHFFDVSSEGKITSCPDATAEATSIAILSETVTAAKR
jgi:hypothetical protein